MKTFCAAFFAVALTTSACAHVPPNVAPEDRVLYLSNEAVVIVGTLQHAAIELNRVQMCDSSVTPPACHPALSDGDTGIVVDAATDAIVAIKATPSGWFAVADAALQRVSSRLGQAGKTELKAYVEAARTALAQLGANR